ncbi:MAG: hypothetical protein OEV36_03535, partial [Myxococcales bacterium]|nr:hypothetical protein [Myxococcales bacterium]
PTASLPIEGWGAVVLCLLSLAVGCGDASAPPFGGTGGTAGAGGMGMGGMSGTGGTGTGGMSGSGGTAGTGGIAGGGAGGTAGGGGGGGAPGPCVTSALCHTCPTQLLCDTDEDCAFSGYVCVPSGCETNQGAPIGLCQPPRGGSCSSVAECPNATDYACSEVAGGPKHCLRVTPGCTGVTETYDCPLGFSCEGGACVDRRVPADNFLDCPKSHVFKSGPSSFCVRVYQTCHLDEDCAGLGTFCEDVDSDGTNECVGQLGSGPCVNSACPSSSAPVCEAGGSGTTATCGDYGLCLTSADCDTGFECLGLWQDGRKECVPINGTCDRVTDCPLQQVCAAPRSGGAPSCQTGTAP